MADNKLIENIFGWIGLIISTYFYCSPVVPFIKVLKGDMKYKDFPGILLMCSMMNCIFWIDYGLLKNKIQVYLTCSIGGTITLIWITIYVIFMAKKDILFSILINLLLLLAMFSLTYKFYNTNVEITGYVALVFNVLMLAAPGEKIINVIKTGKYELIPIFSTIGSLLCSGSWLMFGVYSGDLTLIIPNGLGLLFGVFQLVIYCIFYKKTKSLKSNEEEETKVINI